MSYLVADVPRRFPVAMATAAASAGLALFLSAGVAKATPPHELIQATVPHSLSEAREALVTLIPDARPLAPRRAVDRRRVPLAREIPGPPMVCLRDNPSTATYAALFKRRRCITVIEFERERRLAVLRGRALLGMNAVVSVR